jgi:hypothetical protein
VIPFFTWYFSYQMGFREMGFVLQRRWLTLAVAWGVRWGVKPNDPLHLTPAAFRLSKDYGSFAAGAGELTRSSRAQIARS